MGWKQRTVGLLVAVGLAAGAVGCASSNEEDYPGRPFVSPVDGRTYCAWESMPQECQWSQWPPAPFAMPTGDAYYPSYPGGYSYFEAALAYHIAFNLFYDRVGYYDMYMGPAYARYPHQRVKVINRNTYVTNYQTFDRSHSTQIKQAAATTQYRSKSGKKVSGSAAQKQFSGGNAKSGQSVKSGTSSKGGSWWGGSSSSKGSYGSKSSGSSSRSGSRR